MALAIPRSVVEELLLGAPDARRQLQDSPILGDVWVQFANQPGKAIDLLITPHRTSTANDVAVAIDDRIDVESNGDPNIAYLQGVVAAKLTFREVLRVIVPMTSWWDDPSNQKDLQNYTSGVTGRERLTRSLLSIPGIAKAKGARRKSANPERSSALDRYIALAGLTLWAGGVTGGSPGEEPGSDQEFAIAIQTVTVDQLAGPLLTLLDDIGRVKPVKPRVFQISLNRTANPAIARSVPSVKGDAARNLFSVNCKDIAWAVIDSGIDRTHPAFNDERNKTRIEKTFDFTQFRRIVSLSNLKEDLRARNLAALGKRPGGETDRALRELAEDAKAGRRVNWLIVEELIAVDPYRAPETDHGTHVAGILGASKAAQGKAKLEESECADGMCPDIKLYDFRVLATRGCKDTEFAIIAALQYIRYLNERHASSRSTAPISACRFRTTCATSPAGARRSATSASGWWTAASSWSRPPAICGYPELRDQRRRLRGLRGLQHHRSRQRRRRDHRRRDASLLAAHLRRQLLLEPRADRRRAHQSRISSRRASASAARACPTATGAISTARAWPRRTSAAPPRC